MSNHICLILPFPPSTNNLFVNSSRTRGRFPSKRYREWQEEAGRALLKQMPLPHIAGKFDAIFSFGRPDKRRRDVTNFIKAPEDLIVKHGIVEDDSLAESVLARWDGDVVGVRVEIMPFDAPLFARAG